MEYQVVWVSFFGAETMNYNKLLLVFMLIYLNTTHVRQHTTYKHPLIVSCDNESPKENGKRSENKSFSPCFLCYLCSWRDLDFASLLADFLAEKYKWKQRLKYLLMLQMDLNKRFLTYKYWQSEKRFRLD